MTWQGLCVGLVSRRCDVYSYGILLMKTFTRKRPYEEMFQENLNMRSWVCKSLPVRPDDIIDGTLLQPEEIDFEKKLGRVSSILELALDCTAESPNERLNMKDVSCKTVAINSAGKFKGIDEETIGKTHLEVVQKSNRKSHLRPTVVEPRHILSN